MVKVVMVARGLWETTRYALETLIFTMNEPWRLVFVDNGSDDETRKEFKKIAATWQWTHFEGYDTILYPKGRPVSLSAAWNKAFAKGEPADYTIFANNDIVFHQYGWWAEMRKTLDEGLDLVGIQEMTWYKFRFVEGSLFAARTATFDAIAENGKLFDLRFKLSCEDVDLSERFLRAGLKIGQATVQPEFLVHIGHQTLQHYGSTEDLQGKMHASRTALCKKYGYDEQIND